LATIWITYAWADNTRNDVDFVAQELEKAGVKIKLDRWNIGAGRRLWPQIERFVTDPKECDAWLLYATQSSLGSEACREEFAYALDRALRTRGETFPIIALSPTSVETNLLPAALRVRLCVSLEDPDWKERIKAAAEGRLPEIGRPIVQPFDVTIHRTSARVFIEVRPRVGRWTPVFVAVPSSECHCVAENSCIFTGPSGRLPSAPMTRSPRKLATQDGDWCVFTLDHDASPTESVFLQCVKLPSRIMFGQLTEQEHYVVDLARFGALETNAPN
jgi:TIR domain